MDSESGLIANEGSGELVSRSDLRLIGKLLRRDDFPVSPATRQRLVDRMDEVLVKSKSPRHWISAARALIAADAINAKREAIDVQAARLVPAGVASPPQYEIIDINTLPADELENLFR